MIHHCEIMENLVSTILALTIVNKSPLMFFYIVVIYVMVIRISHGLTTLLKVRGEREELT